MLPVMSLQTYPVRCIRMLWDLITRRTELQTTYGCMGSISMLARSADPSFGSPEFTTADELAVPPGSVVFARIGLLILF